MTWTRRLVYGMTLLLIWVVAAVGLRPPATPPAGKGRNLGPARSRPPPTPH
ncbi:MAG: hypothetical protein ABF708_13195 [Schleiferilactobacillus harbinensis]|uniref:hypothetical protein n=1 Tax=Schleiferilactobacillus harbinensis TaxID=304207 RepID=UPI0039ED21AF